MIKLARPSMKAESELRPVWLLLLREGGQWTVREIMDALPQVGSRVDGTLHMAASRGFLRATRRTNAKRLTYGVTASCKVPRGTTLQDLLAAGAVKPEKEAES